MFEKYLTLLVMEGVSVLVPRGPVMTVPSGWLSYQQKGTAEVLSCIAHDICPCLNKWLCLKGFVEWTLETPVLVNSGVFINPHVRKVICARDFLSTSYIPQVYTYHLI